MFLPVGIRHSSSNKGLYWSSARRQLILRWNLSTTQENNQQQTEKCYHDNRKTSTVSAAAITRQRIQQQRRELSLIREQQQKSSSFTNGKSFDWHQVSRASSNRTNSSSANQPYSSDTKSIKRNKNAYELFSIPPQFIIDEEQLKMKYHELMKQSHPDKQQQQPAVSNDTDTNEDEMAAIITDAYNTLKRPHLRAIQLLRIMMMTTSEPNNKDASDTTTTTDNDDDQFMKQFENAVTNAFLLHIMEIQEEIADLHHEKHQGAIQQHYTNNQQQMEDCYQQLQNAYMNHNIQQFVAYTVQLKYYTRIDETLRNKMS